MDAWHLNSDQQGNQENGMQTLPTSTGSKSASRLIAKSQLEKRITSVYPRKKSSAFLGWLVVCFIVGGVCLFV